MIATHDNGLFVFSHTVEYALRATLYIARQQPRAVRLPEIASAVQAPPRYLAKILSRLARAGILESSRGRTGGYRFLAASRRSALQDVVAVFETPEPRRCLLGSGVCGRNATCSVHERWAPVAASLSAFFGRTTIADLLPQPPSS